MPNDERPSDPIIRKLRGATAELAQIATAEESPIRVNSSLRPQVEDLESLQRSVEQYMASSREIPYVGFLGQFSSGKSALINSLCGFRFLYTDEHASGIEDTTAEATVLADDENSSPILDDRTGPLSIVEQRRTSSFLKTRYVVDTPGKGDPGTQSKVVEEILPLCDALVYVLTAKHPLDDADRILLAYVRDQAVVPVLYCVTHSITFTVDRQAPVIEERIDFARRRHWVDKLNNKLADFVPGLTLVERQMFFVENVDDPQVAMNSSVREGYGIDRLRSAIESLPIDTASVHSVKLDYFWKRLAGIIRTFSDHCESLRTSISELIENIEQAHEKRQQRILGNIDDLKNGWRRASTAFDASATDFEKMCVRLESQCPGVLKSFKWQSDAALAKTAEEAIDSLTNSLAAQISKMARSELAARIEFTRSQWEDIEFFCSDRMLAFNSSHTWSDTVATATRGHLGSSINQLIKGARGNEIRTLRFSLDAAKGVRRELEAFAKEQRLLKQEASFFFQQKKDVEAAIRDFLQSISDFRNSIVAAGGWELVARAGFSGELDQASENDEKAIAASVTRIYQAFAGDIATPREELRRALLAGEKDVASDNTAVIFDRAARALSRAEEDAAAFKLDSATTDSLLKEVLDPTFEQLRASLRAFEEQCENALLLARAAAEKRRVQKGIEARGVWDAETKRLEEAFETEQRKAKRELISAKLAQEADRGRDRHWWFQTWALLIICGIAISAGLVLAIIMPDPIAKTAAIAVLITGAGATLWARLKKLPTGPKQLVPHSAVERPAFPPQPEPSDLRDFAHVQADLPESTSAEALFSEEGLRKILKVRLRERIYGHLNSDSDSHRLKLSEPREDISTLHQNARLALSEYANSWRSLCEQSSVWYGGADEKGGRFLSAILTERRRSVDEIIKIFRDRVVKLDAMLSRFQQLRER